jgi:hypothetical protein
MPNKILKIEVDGIEKVQSIFCSSNPDKMRLTVSMSPRSIDDHVYKIWNDMGDEWMETFLSREGYVLVKKI